MAGIVHRKVQISLAVVGLVALVLLGVAWADGMSANGKPGRAVGTWTPGGELPGARLNSSGLSARGQAGVQAAVRISGGIDAGSIREVVSGGAFGLGMRLVTARGPGGAACVSFITESGGARQFSCFDSPSGDGALLRFAASGGETINKTDWTTLVGLARSDVSRVTLVTQNGTERPLALNRWRGFTYSAASPGDFPAKLRAYDAAGSVIDEVQTLP